MAAIGFGTVIEGLRPFSFNNNINDTYRGEVLCDDGVIVSAFIKDLPLKQLINELVSAAIGLELGLPVPKPILALAAPDVLVGKHVRYRDRGDHLVFCSSAADAKPVLQLIRESGREKEIADRLADWRSLGELYGFDSWLGNIDRHKGNLLLGGDDEIWMIDHGHCLTGPDWTADTLDASAIVRNRLSEWLTPNLSGARKGQAAEEASLLAKGASTTNVEVVLKANKLDQLLASEFVEVVRFLYDRTSLIEPFSKKALGILV